MHFWQKLARTLVYIFAVLLLLAGLGFIFWPGANRPEVQVQLPEDMKKDFGTVVPLSLSPPRALDTEQLAYARTAWKYFENNTDDSTGLAGSADRFPSTTMWETGSYLLAIASADLLDIIDSDVAGARVLKVLESLSGLELFEGSLPNKAYDIRTLKMVDYTNKPTPDGLGWSALDIGRLLASLAIVRQNYPDLSDDIDELLSKWDLSRVVRQGELNGATLIDGHLRQYQEGRLGYEQYAATGFQLFGHEALNALDGSDHYMVKVVEGVPVPVDSRLLGNRKPAMTTSESYLLGGLEFGFDTRALFLASAIYQAQEMRYLNKGILTAVSEGHVTSPPYFAYGSVWGGGAPWAVMGFDGSRMDSLRTLSTKAVFGWDALFATGYTAKLVESVLPIADADRGWPEGIYERNKEVNSSITANTNAVVLEALAFRKLGPLKTN